MFIIKGVVSGHYSHISQFTYKCIMWTVIINEDEEGRYVYRSEIWQALKFDFHKLRQNKVCTYSVDFNTLNLESKYLTHLESLIFSHLALFFHI